MNKKQTAKLFKAKKVVTRKDAKKLKPLTKWLKGVQESDNAIVRARWMVIGAALLATIFLALKRLGV